MKTARLIIFLVCALNFSGCIAVQQEKMTRKVTELVKQNRFEDARNIPIRTYVDNASCAAPGSPAYLFQEKELTSHKEKLIKTIIEPAEQKLFELGRENLKKMTQDVENLVKQNRFDDARNISIQPYLSIPGLYSGHPIYKRLERLAKFHKEDLLCWTY